ncbi:hypothetical protein AKJ09_08058 [Labilithrix luteola]|uniref:Uncharacterized protein n=1 Tax=Labilithrix luteola TaxID=1391654 RepID=A0A0K1Q7L0_9BACT|nr:hypothetical protein AKJ09_08058 [Labilithrix luteola]
MNNRRVRGRPFEDVPRPFDDSETSTISCVANTWRVVAPFAIARRRRRHCAVVIPSVATEKYVFAACYGAGGEK